MFTRKTGRNKRIEKNEGGSAKERKRKGKEKDKAAVLNLLLFLGCIGRRMFWAIPKIY